VFSSHLASDRQFPHFWQAWEHFEGHHGNASTWREMMRVHRSVAASFAAMHFNTTNVESAVPVGAVASGGKDPMAALEAATAAKAPVPIAGFVSGGVQGGEAAEREASGVAASSEVKNPEEIDLGDDEGE
jgi:hypothetical protein